MSIIIRSLFAVARHLQWSRSRGYIDFFGLKLLNVSRAKLVDLIDHAIETGEQRTFAFLNVRRLNAVLKGDDDWRAVVRSLNYLIPYGGSIGLVGQFRATPLVDNLSCADLLPSLCEMAEQKGRSIYLVGGKLGVSAKMMAALGREYTELNIIGENQSSLGNMKDMDSLARRVDELQPDIVLVSMDSPEQELWIARNAPDLACKVVVGVGDLFEVCSGNIRRPSRVIRELGFEWLVRSLREKGGIVRYWIGSPLFVVRALIRSVKGA